MTTQATTDTVQDAVTEALVSFGAERDQVTPTATFQVLDIDSLDLAELAQIVEESFGVQLRAADVSQLASIGDLIELIVARA